MTEDTFLSVLTLHGVSDHCNLERGEFPQAFFPFIVIFLL